MPPFVFNCCKSIRLHIASKEFLSILPNASFKYKNTCSDTNAKEQVFRQFNDFSQTMILQNTLHLGLACLFQLLIRQDKCTLRVSRNVIQHIFNNFHAPIFVLVRRVHQNFRDRLRFHPLAGRISTGIHLLKVGFAVFMDQHVCARQCINFAVKLNSIKMV